MLAPPPAARVHTVFCAECTEDYDYKSLGVFHSHNLSGMPGGVTRLLACDKEELKTYRGLHIGPTFVHQNHKRIWHTRALGPGETDHPFGAARNDSSGSYNKPGSIMHWVREAPEAKGVEYVLYIDADMLLRKPMDPIAMGVRRGVVVSEHVGYLDVGLKNGIARRFLPSEELQGNAVRDLDRYQVPPCVDARCSAGSRVPKSHAAAGWYHFFHMDDIRAIAPRWYHWEREIRLNPQQYWRLPDAHGVPGGVEQDIPTGDVFAQRGEAPWISEMYGYALAAAEAGLKHLLTDGVVVYPDRLGASHFEEAHIIHYGLDCDVGEHFHFTKKRAHSATSCAGQLFGDPPRPTHQERLCAETVWTINDALCDYYARPEAQGGCGLHTPSACPAWQPPLTNPPCEDSEATCHEWAEKGECTANAAFMQSTCPKVCGFCEHERAMVPAWARGLALARGETPPPMKPPTALTVSEQITLSASVGGPARPDEQDGGGAVPDGGAAALRDGGGATRPTGRAGEEASIAPALWRARGPFPDPNHAPASAVLDHGASHGASRAPSSHVPFSHAPSSHAGRRETDRQRNARLSNAARGHAPAASLGAPTPLLADLAPSSHAPARSHAETPADGHGASRPPVDANSHAPDGSAPPPVPSRSSSPASTEQLRLAWLLCLVFCAGLVVGRHVKGRALPWSKKTKMIAEGGLHGSLWPQRDLRV